MTSRAFMLIEFLVILAVIGILAALLLPMLGDAKASAQRTSCSSNLRQINFGLRMYADDSDDKTPRVEGTRTNRQLSYTGYKHLIQTYIGHGEASSPKAKLFACPADRYFYTVSNGFMVAKTEPIHDQSFTDFSSYGFSGGNLRTNLSRFGFDVTHLGIAGRTIGSIRNPVKTVLVAEAPAFRPFSWHQPKLPLSRQNDQFNDAKNMVSFVDGHVSYIKIFWTESVTNSLYLDAGTMNPPPGYDYQWSGD
jgi:prepilin-type processing-associated H-X9-DG protein